MSILRSIFDHLVLPAKLPGKQEEDVEAISDEILKRLIHACERSHTFAEQPWSEAFYNLGTSLNICRRLHSGCLEKSSLVEQFGRLELNHILILYVVEQNAALLIRREI